MRSPSCTLNARPVRVTLACALILSGACTADRAVAPVAGTAATPNVEAQGATSHKRGTVTIALVMRPHTAADVLLTGEGNSVQAMSPRGAGFPTTGPVAVLGV
jgi:hypothetical protein